MNNNYKMSMKNHSLYLILNLLYFVMINMNQTYETLILYHLFDNQKNQWILLSNNL